MATYQYRITYKLNDFVTTTELRYAEDKDSAKAGFLFDMAGAVDDGFALESVAESDIVSVKATGLVK